MGCKVWLWGIYIKEGTEKREKKKNYKNSSIFSQIFFSDSYPFPKTQPFFNKYKYLYIYVLHIYYCEGKLKCWAGSRFDSSKQAVQQPKH